MISVTEAMVLQALVETKCQTAKCLCDAIERKGYPRKDVQLAIQRAIESGVVLCATDWSLSVAAQEGSGVEGLRSDDAPASIEDLDAALRRGREIGGMIVGSADLRRPALHPINPHRQTMIVQSARGEMARWAASMRVHDPILHQTTMDGARDAYLQLLTIPFGTMARLTTDQARAFLRDLVADFEGREPEVVQNDYEAKAFAILTASDTNAPKETR
jgi:hypothetical protein